ncbi:putative mitochondrial protein [Tanacetum coccineum]
MSALKILKYETTVREYEDAFDILLSRVEVSEEHVSLFMGGLPTEIEMGVRMFKPKTLANAYCLTNLQEATLNVVKKKGISAFVPNHSRYTNAFTSNYQKPFLPTPSATTTNTYAKPNTLIIAHVFAIPTELPPTRDHDYKIPLVEGAQPVNIRPYRHPPTKKNSIEGMVARLLQDGVIKKSNSPFSSSIVIVKKKVNSWIKTAFKTREGHYEFWVIPFGLTNAPSTFQSLMNEDNVEHHGHHKLYAKRSKCMFGTDKVEYLGHVISAKGVATNPSKVEAMSKWPMPTTLKQLRGFLGLTRYYRRFIQGYASNSRPLTQLLKKNSFQWTNDSQTAFEQLKQAMEFLAIVYALEKWRGYLFDRHFKIKTDHFSLKYLLDQRMSTPIQLKWLPKLMGFDYEIQYKKGVENVATDALSMLQFSNEKLQKIITKLQQGQDVKGSYSWANQELRRKGRLVVGNGQSLKIELLKQFHEGSVGGHSRVRTTTNKICSVFYWKKLRKHVKQLVLEFHICQRYKLDLAAYPGLLQPLPISTRIWSNISMDFIDSLPKSQCKIVILVVVDRLRGDSRVELVDGSLTAREEVIEVCKFHLKRANDRMKSQAGEVSKSRDLPICNEQGVTKVKHVVILDRRLAKRGNVVVFVLVEWANGTKEDATWEPIVQIQMKFPSFKI